MGKQKMIQAIIVTPTLDLQTGHTACLQAQATAGVGCKFIVVHDLTGQGAAKTANKGLKQALETKIPYICYMNDDVWIKQQGWLKRLIEVMKSDPKLGMAAPGGRCRTKPQKQCRPGMPPNIREAALLAFFCVLCRSKMLEEIGLFDEDFIHYGCDNDLCERARAAGWKLACVEDVWVSHHLSKVIKDWMIKDSAVLKAKRRRR